MVALALVVTEEETSLIYYFLIETKKAFGDLLN
jgi:hypothetical protein